MVGANVYVGEGKGDQQALMGRGNSRPQQGRLAAVHCGLVLVNLGYAGASVLNKLALTTGVNYFVLAVYRDLVALAVLVPTAYFAERKERRPLTAHIILLMVAAGLTGVFGGQCLQLIALSLSSVSITASIPILTPFFTFVISLLLGVEKIRWQKRPGQAKALSMLLSISGGVVLCTVKGAAVLGSEVPKGLTEQLYGGELSNELLYFNLERWQLGAIFVILCGLSYATFIVLQAPALSLYPAPISLTAFSYFFGAIMLGLTALLTNKDSSSWVIDGRAVIALVYTGLVSSAINFTIQAWACHISGPLLVASYIPLQSFSSAILAYLFLGETIFMGSIVGALLIGTGLYLFTWAKATNQHDDGIVLEGDICHPHHTTLINQSNLQQPLLS